MQITKQDEPDHIDLAQLGEEDRLGFIRKVYGILTVQLSVTAGCITVVKLNDGLNESFQSPLLNGISIGLFIVAIGI